VKIAVYPGSFDPITNGHLDIIQRAVKLFDQVIVAVARREEKHPLFTPEEREELCRKVLAQYPNIVVTSFSDLLVDFTRRMKADTIIRGLRAVLDFDYEFQMVLTNRKIAPDVDTVFFLPSERYFYLSSSMVKEIAALGGPVSCFVPKDALDALKTKFATCH
jgi:pantetheine-phosphate adenylyltransferase